MYLWFLFLAICFIFVDFNISNIEMEFPLQNLPFLKDFFPFYFVLLLKIFISKAEWHKIERKKRRKSERDREREREGEKEYIFHVVEDAQTIQDCASVPGESKDLWTLVLFHGDRIPVISIITWYHSYCALTESQIGQKGARTQANNSDMWCVCSLS